MSESEVKPEKDATGSFKTWSKSEMEELLQTHPTIYYLKRDMSNAHRRIDGVVEELQQMQASISHIEGCIKPMSDDVREIKGAVLRAFESYNEGRNGLAQKAIDATVKVVIAILLITGLALVGYMAINVQGKSGQHEIKASGQN